MRCDTPRLKGALNFEESALICFLDERGPIRDHKVWGEAQRRQSAKHEHPVVWTVTVSDERAVAVLESEDRDAIFRRMRRYGWLHRIAKHPGSLSVNVCGRWLPGSRPTCERQVANMLGAALREHMRNRTECRPCVSAGDK